VNVTRNGEIVNMSVYELLVGDLVQVETGEIMSVDGIVYNASNISMDESSVTGETHQVSKKDYYKVTTD
jgi:P-type Ca2+ transporter type 2C